MPSKLWTAFLISTSAGLFIYANALSLRWGKSRDLIALLLCMTCSSVAYIIFGKIAAGRGVAVASGLIDSMILIGTVSIGIFVFGEALSMRQTFGLCSAVLAVILLF